MSLPLKKKQKPIDIVREKIDGLKTRYVVGVDIGTSKMSVTKYMGDNIIPLSEHASLMRTKDGRLYNKYQECNVVEMTYNWLGERWKDFFNDACLVLLEKQMTRLKSNEERGCIDVNMILHAILHHLHTLGGPMVVVVGPVAWKNLAGIEVGGDNKSITPARCVNGVFYQSEVNKDHDRNKQRSKDKFKEWTKKYRSFQLLGERNPPPTVDEMESSIIAKVGYDNLERFVEEAMTYRNHNRLVGIDSNISTVDRMIPWPTLSNYKIEHVPAQVKLDMYVTNKSNKTSKPPNPNKKKRSRKELNIIEESNNELSDG